MSKSVKFDEYGPVDVLKLVEAPMPDPKDNEVVVQVKAAGINPGEDKIRDGSMRDMFPATFPSGEGTDFAGVVTAVGTMVNDFKVGDEVAGYTHNRASHAEFVVESDQNVTIKPGNVSFEVAGSLYVAGSTAYAAVNAVAPTSGDVMIVSGAGGGVGSIAAQYALSLGAIVYGIAGPHDVDWLEGRGIKAISYDKDVSEQIKAADVEPSCMVDTSGKGYVKLGVDLGINPQRINTIIDFPAVQEFGVQAKGSSDATGIGTLDALLKLVSEDKIEIPIAKTFPLDNVQEAYTFLTDEHHRGKVVLIP
jgi:NADPH:quinone reductase-like Zn-dependent oxidoreductase